MKRGSIALSIKRLTAPDHVQAEQAVERAAPFASRASYIAYLAKLHAFYAAIEPVLFATANLPAERRKLPRIERDLAVLGGTSTPADVRAPRIVSLAHAYGVGYVLEGKTLGSRFLLEEARMQLGLDETSGASFLAGYGAQTGAMWRGYLETLTAFVASSGRRHAIVCAARQTFACFTALVGSTSRGETPSSRRR